MESSKILQGNRMKILIQCISESKVETSLDITTASWESCSLIDGVMVVTRLGWSCDRTPRMVARIS